MSDFLKLTSGLAIMIGIHLASCYSASAEVIASSDRALPNYSGDQKVHSNRVTTPAGRLVSAGTKDSSSYEPPVEGGPQASQGSGTR